MGDADVSKPAGHTVTDAHDGGTRDTPLHVPLRNCVVVQLNGSVHGAHTLSWAARQPPDTYCPLGHGVQGAHTVSCEREHVAVMYSPSTHAAVHAEQFCGPPTDLNKPATHAAHTALDVDVEGTA